MSQNIVRERLKVDGMSCGNCEVKIEKKLRAAKGVQKVRASYSSQTVEITYDENIIKSSEIKQIISQLGYRTVKSRGKQNKENKSSDVMWFVCAAVILLGAFVIIHYFGGFSVLNAFPLAEESMGYAALFVVGLLTSVHCVSMCGGINLSQCATVNIISKNSKLAPLRPSVLYNAGRVLSYTVLGGIIGGLGSVVSFSGAARGTVVILAGVFMIIMGLNMLNLFPWLRKFNFRLPKFLTGRINRREKNIGPLYVGLLNGLMPCGPLQAMQLYALSAGSPLKGAISMFIFSLGTVPLMFGMGAASTFLSKRFTGKMLRVSAVLVMIMGLTMLSNGLSLSGIMLFDRNAPAVSEDRDNSKEDEITMVDGFQVVSVSITSRSYAPITVKKGIPVKWTIHAEARNLTGCNNEIIIPEYNITKPLVPGDNIIEFTPEETGVIPYSCWMGMIKSKITVIE